jgi:hypothetical protein
LAAERLRRSPYGVLPLLGILREDEHVDDGIRALDLSSCGVVPVLASDGERVVGWFDYRSALATFR